MNAAFDGLDCRLKVSGMVADSIMMGIVRTAMEEAYGRIHLKEGDLARLNDRSRFCELAILQLEWCLKFLKEEMDVYIAESNRERERLLGDLEETRDRMQKRMEDIETAISHKDSELMELRRELELKDKELRLLRASSDLDSRRQELEFIPIDIDSTIEMAKGEIQQRMWDVRHKMDETRTYCRKEMQDIQLNAMEELRDSEATEYEQVIVVEHSKIEKCDQSHSMREIDDLFEQMSMDFAAVEEKVEQAFQIMDASISSCKLTMNDARWCYDLEKEIIIIYLNVTTREFCFSFNGKHGEKGGDICQVPRERLHWTFLTDIVGLRDDLELLISQIDDVQLKDVRNSLSGRLGRSLSTSPKKSPFFIAKDFNDSAKLSQPVQSDNSPRDAHQKQARNFVSELIRNHESIIRTKIQEASWLGDGFPRDKKQFPTRNNEDLPFFKKMIKEIISRLEVVIRENTGLLKDFDDFQGDRLLNIACIQKDEPKIRPTANEQFAGQSFDASSKNTCLQLGPLKVLPEGEPHISNSKTMTSSEGIFLSSDKTCDDIRFECDGFVYSQIQEDVYRVVLSEMVKQWNHDIKNREKLEAQPILEAPNFNLKAVKCEDVLHVEHDDIVISNQIREDVSKVMFGEMMKQWNACMDVRKILKVQPEIKPQDFGEINMKVGAPSSTVEGSTDASHLECIDHVILSQIRESIWMVMLYEMIKQSSNDELSIQSCELKGIGSIEGSGELDISFSKMEPRRAKVASPLQLDNTPYNIEMQISEDIFKLVLIERVKQLNHATSNIHMAFISCPYELRQDVESEISKLNSAKRTCLECQDAEVETKLCHDVYVTVLNEVMEQWNHVMQTYEREKLIMESGQLTTGHVIKNTKSLACNTTKSDNKSVSSIDQEMQSDWFISHVREDYEFERFIWEETYCIVFGEVLKYLKCLVNLQEEGMQKNEPLSPVNQDYESPILIGAKTAHAVSNQYCEDTYTTAAAIEQKENREFRQYEMKDMEVSSCVRPEYEVENLIREEINHLTFAHTIKDINCLRDANSNLPENRLSLEHDLKENELLSRVRQDCEFEMLIKEEIYFVVFDQAIKDKCLSNSTENVQEGNTSVMPQHNHEMQQNQSFEIVGLQNEKCTDQNALHKLAGHYVAESSAGHANSQVGVYKVNTKNEKPKLDGGKLLQASKDLHLGTIGSSDGGFINYAETIQGQVVAFPNAIQRGEPHSTTPCSAEICCSEELISMLIPLDQLSFKAEEFKIVVCNKLGANIMRLDGLRHQVKTIFGKMRTIIGEKLLYQKAFFRRCQALQTAEAEVDILGDEVDALLALLKYTHDGLQKYMPIFKHHRGMMDILKLIGNELHGEISLVSS